MRALMSHHMRAVAMLAADGPTLVELGLLGCAAQERRGPGAAAAGAGGPGDPDRDVLLGRHAALQQPFEHPPDLGRTITGIKEDLAATQAGPFECDASISRGELPPVDT